MNASLLFATALGTSFGTALLSVAAQAQTPPTLLTYDVPQAALYTHHVDDFTVRVRVPGGEWQDLYEYRVKVDLDDPQTASMVYFDIAGPVEVAVKKNNGDVSRVEVRPASKGVRARLIGNTAYFTLTKPANISVEFDGDRLHNLHLFANPIDQSPPDPKGAGVIYFGPGIHVPPAGQTSFKIPSNTTVYIAGGALVRGQIDVVDADNVRILGHGIIEQSQEGLAIVKSRNVTIDGPIVVNPKHYTVMCGQSTGLTIRNLKAFSAGSWTDGIDLMSCSDVRIDNVFLRNSDDTIAIYGRRGEYSGDARNYLITNSTLWPDVAHPINIGLHGDDKHPEVIENLVFRNIDVLGHDEDDRNYQGVMAITDGDNNLVRNVLFEDIRIDNIEEGMIFNFRAVFNEKYSLAPGRGIENVTIRNVRFKGGDINRSVIAGYAADRAVRDVTIENVRVGNKALKRSDIDVGAFVENLVVKSR
jgi:hypothetical protein